MRTSRDDADLENRYGAKVVSRTPLGWLSVDVVQAFVPFGQLCPLASDWRILRIEAIRLQGRGLPGQDRDVPAGCWQHQRLLRAAVCSAPAARIYADELDRLDRYPREHAAS